MRASLDWLSGRLKGGLKRRALLLRSRSIPPSRSMSTAVHGCWEYAGTRVLGRIPTVPTVRVETVHELSKAGADAGCVWRRNNAIAREHTVSQPVTRSVSHPLIEFHRLPSFLYSLVSCFYSISTAASRLAISNRAGGPGTKRQKKKHVSKGIGQGEEPTQWPGLGVLFACPVLPAIDREMLMSMPNPSKAQELPSHFIPLSYLVYIQYVLRSAVNGLQQHVSSPPPVGRCQRMCQPKWLSPFKTSRRACRACRALVLPPHTSFSPDTAMGPSRITRKLSVVQGEKEVSE